MCLQNDVVYTVCLQKNPIDYLTQIRPDTETMNQTLRMLGTYKSDYAAAAQ
jgi:hypothetical protein